MAFLESVCYCWKVHGAVGKVDGFVGMCTALSKSVRQQWKLRSAAGKSSSSVEAVALVTVYVVRGKISSSRYVLVADLTRAIAAREFASSERAHHQGKV